MDWKSDYAGKRTTAQEAFRCVGSGDRVVFAHACGEPLELVDALVARAGELDGNAVINLPSTAKRGVVSRIVAAPIPGTAVTTMRADVDYIVTEPEAAHLRGLGLRERAEALIEIADPAFRDQIREQAPEVYGISRQAGRGGRLGD
jgi:acyl-CoA hydrolase